jgi:O-antigen ligase
MLAVAVLVLTGAGLAAARGVTGADYIARRFESIGEDPGSTSRLTLWTGGAQVFAAHPFGVGLGNAVPMIERELGENIKEDNLHNLYLQHLVDTGMQGLAVFLLLAALAWRRVLVTRLQDPMILYTGIYFVLALLQFRGAEALLWFVYGLQQGSATREEGAYAAA